MSGNLLLLSFVKQFIECSFACRSIKSVHMHPLTFYLQDKNINFPTYVKKQIKMHSPSEGFVVETCIGTAFHCEQT